MGATVRRDYSIDIMKALLVIGMVFAHVLQLDVLKPLSAPAGFFSDFINLVTFSGFMFCFGYVYRIAYSGKPSPGRVAGAVLKPLAAFYISGILYRTLMSNADLGAKDLLDILILSDIPGYSEFLASFAIMSLFYFVFRKWITRIVVTPWRFLLLVLPLAFCFFPYGIVRANQIGLVVGSTAFAAFPVVQYSFWFFLGMIFSERRTGFRAAPFAVSAVATIAFISWSIVYRNYPSRFPPSALWIVGPALFLYGYLLLAKLMERRLLPGIRRVLVNVGENTILYLLFSNIFIFALTKYRLFEEWQVFLIAPAILLSVYYFVATVRKAPGGISRVP